MPRPCSFLGHRVASTPTALYFDVPTENPTVPDRWKAWLCARHGRQFLTDLYRRGVDLVAELDDPAACFGCGVTEWREPIGCSVFEDDWYARFHFVLCEQCWRAWPDCLGDALERAEKAPPREDSTRRGSARKRPK